MDTWPLESYLVWAEQDFRGLVLLRSQLYDLTIWQVVIGGHFVISIIPLSVFHILVDWYRYIALELFDSLHDFKLSSGVENVA